jgi:hypothetical protein
MFKKPFNKKEGEDRICKKCGDAFHAKKPIWKCQKCINAAQKIIEEKKRALYNKKDRYPFDTKTNEAGRRFCSITTKLNKAWKEYERTGDKTYVNEHYDRQLKEIQENGILTWILDRRSLDAKRENNPNKRTRNMIKADYPDTRGYYEE